MLESAEKVHPEKGKHDFWFRVTQYNGNRAWCQMSPVINVLLTLNLSSDYLADYLNRFYDHHKAIVTYAFHQDKKLLQEIRDQNESAKRKSIENLKRIRLSN